MLGQQYKHVQESNTSILVRASRVQRQGARNETRKSSRESKRASRRVVGSRNPAAVPVRRTNNCRHSRHEPQPEQGSSTAGVRVARRASNVNREEVQRLQEQFHSGLLETLKRQTAAPLPARRAAWSTTSTAVSHSPCVVGSNAGEGETNNMQPKNEARSTEHHHNRRNRPNNKE